MPFTLHPRLQQETTLVGELPLCTVLLCRDDSVPWVILVPKIDGVRELHQLSMDTQQQFLLESKHLCQALEHLFKPDKMNIGALGNLVPQLHVHHVVRFITDIAWPGPIWGNTESNHRSEEEQLALTKQLQDELSKDRSFHFRAY